MLTRRSFVRRSLLAAALPLAGCRVRAEETAATRIEISLAQWSLHRTIYSGRLDHLDFPAKSRNDFGISVVEYVNGFFGGGSVDFRQAGKSAAYLKELLKRSRDARQSRTTRNGSKPPGSWAAGPFASTFMATARLRRNARPRSIRWTGWAISPKRWGSTWLWRTHGAWLASVIQQVARPNVGTLPDFGNFCSTHPWGNH